MTDLASHLAALDAAVGAYIDAIENVARSAGSSQSAQLRRVRAARQAREAVLEFAEQHLDHAIEAARQRSPEGHKLAEIGAELGITAQAVGKRIHSRGLDGERTIPTREQRAELQRQQRAENAALTRAARRWGVRSLRRVEDDDGRVGFAPIAGDGEVEWARPAGPVLADAPWSAPPASSPRPYRPPAAPPDRRTFTDARDRALRGMSGADVFTADRGDTAPGNRAPPIRRNGRRADRKDQKMNRGIGITRRNREFHRRCAKVSPRPQETTGFPRALPSARRPSCPPSEMCTNPRFLRRVSRAR